MKQTPLAWNGKTVLVMGLGIKDGGVSSVRFALSRGASVRVTDLQKAPALQSSLDSLSGLPVKYFLGGHREEDFISADIVIKNPAIRPEHPLLELAHKHGATVETPETIFCRLSDKPWTGVTGTKGKSLVTELTAFLINHFKGPCVAAGNNCRSPLPFLETPQPDFVMELSSWQLRDMGAVRASPHIACWLNFFPDHMNYYRSMDDYHRDKHNITAFQTKEDFCLLPHADAALSAVPTRAAVLRFSGTETVPFGCGFSNGVFRFTGPFGAGEILEEAELPRCLRVPHWRGGVAAAMALACLHMGETRHMASAISGFPGLPHRFEVFHREGGMLCINDSAATTPDSVCLALKSAPRGPVVLIAGGGGSKGLDCSAMAEAIRRRVSLLVLFERDPASRRISAGLSGSAARVVEVPDMNQAAKAGIEYIRNAGGGTLLLSPGTSGAPVYPDLFVRGDIFKRAVLDSLKGTL